MIQIDQTGYCVAVIESDEELLSHYKISLTDSIRNCRVATFISTGDNFFNFIRDTYIDLFIIDINLSNGYKDEIDLASKLLKTMTGLTFLFISNNGYTLDSFKEFDGKCIYDYISKPVHSKELLIRVKALLNISRSYNRVLRYFDIVKEELHEISVDALRSRYLDTIRQDRIMIEKLKGKTFK